MPRSLRTLIFSMLLGFHNAWDQDDAALEELSVRFKAEYRSPIGHVLDDPEHCFFWGESSLLN